MIVEINGFELNYEMAGDGEPLLWLHGFMGTGPDWKCIFKEPPSGFQLIAPDLRGRGHRQIPPVNFRSGEPPMTWRDCSVISGSTQ